MEAAKSSGVYKKLAKRRRGIQKSPFVIHSDQRKFQYTSEEYKQGQKNGKIVFGKGNPWDNACHRKLSFTDQERMDQLSTFRNEERTKKSRISNDIEDSTIRSGSHSHCGIRIPDEY
ncbi:hypothetical protein [Dubosiella newyorkensis]|uniref:hypothetical protein n=1 Tax=Dubosiella newyorkensis TaxID=1862672 RepID=UPI003F6666FD